MIEFVALVAIKLAFLIVLSVRIFSYVVRDNKQLEAETTLLEHLEAFAADTDLRLAEVRKERHRVAPQRVRLVGEQLGAHTEVGLDLIPHGGHLRLSNLEITLKPEHGLDLGLTVLSRDADLFGLHPWPRVAAAGDGEPLPVGDDAFDALFTVKARSPERALQVLNSQVRGLLCELVELPNTTLRLTDEALTIRVDLKRAWLSEEAVFGVLAPHLRRLPEQLRQMAQVLHDGHTRAEVLEAQHIAPVVAAAVTSA